MASNYRLILGGTEIHLDPSHQWTDEELWSLLRASTPKSLPVQGGGSVTFMPGPGVAVVRHEAGGQVF
ncbi:hypothetical protein GA0004736_3400 [Curtobacterium sp. 9128]|uniref:hypothetical protein n=1 Tax=Curtobacterium sp. 9128 TaxID=1793722 RepID=UPI0007D71B5F|nr:hypothetical protein [Curtobacterium sp. 9128]SBN64440.1 hypothetical protein GA0004736_3400 [Curtobacterium sp. 9128]